MINDFGASGHVSLGEALAHHEVDAHILVCSLTIIVCGGDRALGTTKRFMDQLMVIHADHIIGNGMRITHILDSGNYMMDTVLILLLCDSM